MVIKIGKSPDNDYVIDNPLVSRHHALLKITQEGEYLLEDLASGNGTYVNGQQILRKKITSADQISLGGECKILLEDVLNAKNDYTTGFEQLKKVYDSYQKEKVKIQSSNQFKTRLFQSLPFVLPGVIGICFGITGIAGKKILYISLLIAIIAPVLGIIMGAKQAAKTPAQLQKLSDKFKTDYVCPKCGMFLGEIPWQSLKNRGKCPNSSCKANW